MPDTERYASLDDIPLTGPDPYTEDEKLEAIRRANGQLEADVNGGDEILSPEDIHNTATAAYATYILALGPKEPGSVTRGGLADEGSERMNFTHELYRIYERAVKAINEAPGDEGEGSGPVSVWTTRDF